MGSTSTNSYLYFPLKRIALALQSKKNFPLKNKSRLTDFKKKYKVSFEQLDAPGKGEGLPKSCKKDSRAILKSLNAFKMVQFEHL